MDGIQLFEKLVIGRPEFCRLMNPEDLIFSITKQSKVSEITYTAKGPLIVVNRYSGFKLIVILKKATLMSYQDQYSLNHQTKIHFKELHPANDVESQIWDDIRMKLYCGSLRHFLTSLASRRIQEEGFVIAKMRPIIEQIYDMSLNKIHFPRFVPKPDPYSIVLRNEVNDKNILDFSGFIEVTFKNALQDKDKARWFHGILHDRQVSIITLPEGPVLFDDFGLITNDKPVRKFGYWGAEMISELLPDTYVPSWIGLEMAT